MVGKPLLTVRANNFVQQPGCHDKTACSLAGTYTSDPLATGSPAAT